MTARQKKARPGRPRKWRDDAERMRAHRAAQARSGVKSLVIALDEKNFEALDDLAQRLGMTRSEAVAHLIDRHAGPKKKRLKPAEQSGQTYLDLPD